MNININIFSFLKKIILLLGFCCFSLSSVAADCIAQTLSSQMSGRLNTSNIKLLMLEDPREQLSIADVAALPNKAFKKSTGSIGSAARGGAVWLRLCLVRGADAPERWLLSVLPAYTKRITLYEPFDGGYRARKQGAVEPWSSRELGYRGFTYQLDLKDHQPVMYTIKIDVFNRITADLLLLTPDKMYQLIAVDYSLFGFHLGAACLVVIINLLFWLWFREPIYWRYALSVIFFSVFTTVIGGYASKLLFFQGGFAIFPWMMVSASLFFASFHLLFQTVFQLSGCYRKSYFVSRVLAVAYVLFACVFLVARDVWLYNVYSYFYMLSMALFLFVIIDDVFIKRRFVLYSVAFLPLLISLLLSSLKASGFSAWMSFADYFPNVAVLIHLVLINVVLVKRAWRSEEGKINASNELLSRAGDYNRVLAREVSSRTKTLLQASEDLKVEVANRKGAEEKLRELLLQEQEARKEKGAFVALVSHEFRSPLAVIDIAAQNLERQFYSFDQDVLKRIKNIRESVGRLDLLIIKFLENDRLSEEEQRKLALKDVCLNHFITRVLLKYQCDNRLQVNISEQEIYSSIDEGLLSVAVGNLIENALKYSEDETLVVVDFKVVEGWTEIEVSDAGRSIKEQDRDKIFLKYYRSDLSHARSGSGLGLFLARAIVEQHGGSLVLLPAPSSGVGNSFVVKLPI
ncbi:sensor histidine kinase [Gilvimarinus polysaccharolyticus]|uniref:sensor histidine kinase n=1 Tax=Gilvimarinus polysaccharolyticus TaxID=863921 RepID=UPI0012FBD76E|nr:sensor histidine kinase [Gilvimarinus polysaccharolyticus]